MSQSGKCGLQLLLFQSLKPTMSIIAIIGITVRMKQYDSTNHTLINKTLPQMNSSITFVNKRNSLPPLLVPFHQLSSVPLH